MFTFPLSTVRRIIEQGEEDAAANGGFRNPYGLEPEKARRGLWLVGDRGVYIMSNGKLPETRKPYVCYARECNPSNGGDWYEYKRRHFGGDDGIEFFPAEDLLPLVEKHPNGFLRIDLTENSIELSVVDR